MWPEFAFKCSSPKLHFLKQDNVDFAELWLQIGSQCIRGHVVRISRYWPSKAPGQQNPWMC